MCKSVLLAPIKLGKRLTDKVDPLSSYLRKQGWAGNGFNPAHMLSAAVIGEKTDTDKRAATMNNPPRAVKADSGLVSAVNSAAGVSPVNPATGLRTLKADSGLGIGGS